MRKGAMKLDGERIDRFCASMGMTMDAFAAKANLTGRTLRRAIHGKAVFQTNAQAIATAMDVPLRELLRDSRLHDADERTEFEPQGVNEWEVAENLGSVKIASNQLRFRVCRMSHKHHAHRRARGKCYDLVYMATRDREELQERILRHPEVCRRVGVHRNVALNLTTLPSPKGGVWWVIDDWLDGMMLSERLESGTIATDRIPQLMGDIASGLEALHRANIVFRELSPEHVLVSERDGRAILTDFELAKFLDVGPSVSAGWAKDLYRAPEVESGSVDVKADLYSWGRILIRVATGELPEPGTDKSVLRKAHLPRQVKGIVGQCVSLARNDRPENIQQVIRSIGQWSA